MGVQVVYLYSNASDMAEKKAKLALVMWKTATLPAHHMQVWLHNIQLPWLRSALPTGSVRSQLFLQLRGVHSQAMSRRLGSGMVSVSTAQLFSRHGHAHM